MMKFLTRTSKPSVSRRDALRARPRRLIEARVEAIADGGARLIIPMKSPTRLAWLFKMPAGATKTFELDAIGKFVWDRCDGKTSAEQIIRALAKQYKLGHRQAEMPTVAFLQMLARKGLIGLEMEAAKS